MCFPVPTDDARVQTIVQNDNLFNKLMQTILDNVNKVH